MRTIRRLECRLGRIARVSRVDGPSALMLVFAAWLAAVVVVPAIVGHGATVPGGFAILAVAFALVVGLHLRVRHVERVMSGGLRTRARVRGTRIAGALTYVTCQLPDDLSVTLAYVTRNIDLERLRPGQSVEVAHLGHDRRRAVLVDVYA